MRTNGGLVGISGSSQYLGDAVASSAGIFRHIDYFVQKLGPSHVALGLDLVFDAKPLDAWMQARPQEWPMVLDPDWRGVRYAKPQQLEEVVQLMLQPELAVRQQIEIQGSLLATFSASSWPRIVAMPAIRTLADDGLGRSQAQHRRNRTCAYGQVAMMNTGEVKFTDEIGRSMGIGEFRRTFEQAGGVRSRFGDGSGGEGQWKDGEFTDGSEVMKLVYLRANEYLAASTEGVLGATDGVLSFGERCKRSAS